MSKERIIIVVDDNWEVVEAMREFLDIDFPAHSVKTAANGKEALDLYKAHKDQVALIITDNSMPVMTGAELLITLRRSHDRIPVIMVSGDSEPWYATSLKNFGLNSFLAKPADLNQLHKDIDEALAQ
jgi:CheY-like chemotaxis protein